MATIKSLLGIENITLWENMDEEAMKKYFEPFVIVVERKKPEPKEDNKDPATTEEKAMKKTKKAKVDIGELQRMLLEAQTTLSKGGQ